MTILITAAGLSDWQSALLAWYVFYIVMSIVVVGCLLLVRSFGFRYMTPRYSTASRGATT